MHRLTVVVDMDVAPFTDPDRNPLTVLSEILEKASGQDIHKRGVIILDNDQGERLGTVGADDRLMHR